MRSLLARLALTSEGSTATMDADRGGGSARHYGSSMLAGTLRGGQPHRHFQRLYNAARTRAEKEIVRDQAKAALEDITHSPPPSTTSQTREELHAWIVKHCEGLGRHDAAVRAYTGVSTVFRARIEAGREPDRGRQPNKIHYDSSADRRRMVRELADDDMSMSSIAQFLGLSYNTVRRDLGKPA